MFYILCVYFIIGLFAGGALFSDIIKEHNKLFGSAMAAIALTLFWPLFLVMACCAVCKNDKKLKAK